MAVFIDKQLFQFVTSHNMGLGADPLVSYSTQQSGPIVGISTLVFQVVLLLAGR